MRLANRNGRVVLVVDDGCVDVETLSGGRFGPDARSVYEHWDRFRDWAGRATPAEPTALLDGADLGPPSPDPRQVFAIGLNYADHVEETGGGRPEAPLTFTKFPTCLAGDRAHVALPTPRVDWEVELVVVIGRRCERAREASAWDFVAGVCVGQDLSARDVQMRGSPPQFALGKSFPGFGPVGPHLVTPDELDARDDLRITCALNGELVQDARTSQMLFAVPELIAFLSGICPLLPGDLIFTGTPAGVGFASDPPRFLAPGDVLTSTVEGVGVLTTTLRQDPSPSTQR